MESTSQANEQEFFYFSHDPHYPRDSVRVQIRGGGELTTTRTAIWQRVLPAPPVPAQTNDSLPAEQGGSVADDECTPDQSGGEAVDELFDDLAHLDDLDATWGFGEDAFLQERSQQAPAAGGAGDGTAETTGSSEAGTVDDPSVPAGTADSDSSSASTTDTDQESGVDPPAVLSMREAHELNDYCGRTHRDYRGADPVTPNA